jgi:hypothetical protein
MDCIFRSSSDRLRTNGWSDILFKGLTEQTDTPEERYTEQFLILFSPEPVADISYRLDKYHPRFFYLAA